MKNYYEVVIPDLDKNIRCTTPEQVYITLAKSERDGHIAWAEINGKDVGGLQGDDSGFYASFPPKEQVAGMELNLNAYMKVYNNIRNQHYKSKDKFTNFSDLDENIKKESCFMCGGRGYHDCSVCDGAGHFQKYGEQLTCHHCSKYTDPNSSDYKEEFLPGEVPCDRCQINKYIRGNEMSLTEEIQKYSNILKEANPYTIAKTKPVEDKKPKLSDRENWIRGKKEADAAKKKPISEDDDDTPPARTYPEESPYVHTHTTILPKILQQIILNS